MADNDTSQDPALAHFNYAAEFTKSTLKSTVMGAAKGALIGGLVALAAATVLGAVLGGLIFSVITVPAAIGGAAWMGLVAGGAILGAKIGGGWGALTGLLNADDDVSKKEEETRGNYSRKLVRENGQRMAETQMAQMEARMPAQGLGISPGSLPLGRAPEGPKVG